MPIKSKLFELNNGKRVWVRQASGLEKLPLETAHAKALRKCRHFGNSPAEWTEEQQEEFLVALEDAGGSMEDQIRTLVPPCLMEETDLNLIDRDTLMEIFDFVRGNEEPEGAIPLDSWVK